MPWRGPEYEGELPTLGWYVLDWMADELVVPDGPFAGEPLVLTQEQAQFVLDYYVIDPVTGKRRVRRGVVSRSKGWGKSPILGAVSIVEALGDVVPDGWDASGEPVGRPWTSFGYKAKVQIAAVSEDQTANTWEPVLDMVRSGPVLDHYDITPMETFISLPRGRIEYVTSSATSREGGRPIFAVFDQTESWRAENGGVKLASAIRRNLTKTGGTSIESPNAFAPGMNSVAEKSYEAWRAQQEGKLKARAGGILFDHREAPPETDPTDRASLLAGLAVAYGCSADAKCVLPGHDHEPGWVDLDRVVEDFWDPSTDPAEARQFFLNQITSATDAWLTQPEWAGARAAGDVEVGPREAITLGFDGSRKRNRGVTDATALVACRVSDGYTWLIEAWEQPEGPAGDAWEVPVTAVDATVRATFAKHHVVGFYADPAKWESYIAAWEADFGSQLKVKATREHPIEWWMVGGRAAQTVRALEQFHTAVLERELSHGGPHDDVLTRHVLNARRRVSRSGLQIAKEHPDSARKIDAAVAAVLAWNARVDAIAKGLAGKRRSGKLVRY